MKEVVGVLIVLVLAFLVTTGVINIGHKPAAPPPLPATGPARLARPLSRN